MVASSAYYQLIGERFEYSGTSLHTVLGRAHASSPSSFFSLGDSKTVSRVHVALTYSPVSSGWFVVVLGKNAVQVDGVSYKRAVTAQGVEGPEVKVPISSQRSTAIKVGDVKLWFCPAYTAAA